MIREYTNYKNHKTTNKKSEISTDITGRTIVQILCMFFACLCFILNKTNLLLFDYLIFLKLFYDFYLKKIYFHKETQNRKNLFYSIKNKTKKYQKIYKQG